MRAAIVVVALAACGHPRDASVAVSVKLTCGDHASSLAVGSDMRLDDHVCGAPWTALRIEHGTRTELVHAVAGREVWLRRIDQRAVVEVRAGSAVTSTFDGVTEIADDANRQAAAASIEIEANGRVTNVPLADLAAQHAGSGSGARDISLCALAASYVAHPVRIEIAGDAGPPIVVTPDECAARGLMLRVSGKGELRLRTASGDHLLQHVNRLVIAL